MIVVLPKFPARFGIEPLSKILTGVFSGVAVTDSAKIPLTDELNRSRERFRPCIDSYSSSSRLTRLARHDLLVSRALGILDTRWSLFGLFWPVLKWEPIKRQGVICRVSASWQRASNIRDENGITVRKKIYDAAFACARNWDYHRLGWLASLFVGKIVGWIASAFR